MLVAIVSAAAIATARARRPARVSAAAAPASWTQGAGDEFETLSDAQRCDLVFAVAALDDDASLELLERALEDPSESVALAAARALRRRGENGALERYFSAHPGERARTLRVLVEILD